MHPHSQRQTLLSQRHNLYPLCLTPMHNTRSDLRSAVGGRTLLWDTTKTSPCSWAGVVCDNNRVVELHLPGLALSGEILLDIFGNLTSLRTVPPGLEAMDSIGSTSAEPIVHRPITAGERKLSRRPSKKLLANGLLLLGGLVCLSRGRSSLGAKVAMAYILTKLNKRGTSSSQNGEIAGIGS